MKNPILFLTLVASIFIGSRAEEVSVNSVGDSAQSSAFVEATSRSQARAQALAQMETSLFVPDRKYNEDHWANFGKYWLALLDYTGYDTPDEEKESFIQTLQDAHASGITFSDKKLSLIMKNQSMKKFNKIPAKTHEGLFSVFLNKVTLQHSKSDDSKEPRKLSSFKDLPKKRRSDYETRISNRK